MTIPFTIRAYQHGDRKAIRQICCDTADAGKPLENFFSDRELAADLITRYYTDFLADYTWVVAREGNVEGYLSGAPDTRVFRRTLYWRIAPTALLLALCRGTVFTRSATACLMALIRRRGALRQPPFAIPAEYPAHVHVNLRDSVRGHGVGWRLIRVFFDKLAVEGICGVHACVRADNHGAQAFFRRAGFGLIGGYSELLPTRKGVRDVEVSVLGCKVA